MILFADDIVICEETKEKVEQRIECWRYALERRGIKISWSKTQYLCVNVGNDDETVKMEVTKVPSSFKSCNHYFLVFKLTKTISFTFR